MSFRQLLRLSVLPDVSCLQQGKNFLEITALVVYKMTKEKQKSSFKVALELEMVVRTTAMESTDGLTRGMEVYHCVVQSLYQ